MVQYLYSVFFCNFILFIPGVIFRSNYYTFIFHKIVCTYFSTLTPYLIEPNKLICFVQNNMTVSKFQYSSYSKSGIFYYTLIVNYLFIFTRKRL